MSINDAFTARSSQLPVNKFQFGAALGLVNAAAQFIPPYHGALTVLTTTPGSIVATENQSLIISMRVRYVGDAANVAGQTLSFQLLQNGVAVPAAVIASLATTAGAQTGSVNFQTAGVAVAEGDVFTCTVTPSAALTAAVTGITCAVG